MISAVIFDLDGTLTNTPSPWRYVHERLGVWENTACNYLDEWLAGKMSYEEFCQRDTKLWNGRSVNEIYAYLDEIELNRHVPAVVERLRTAVQDEQRLHVVLDPGVHEKTVCGRNWILSGSMNFTVSGLGSNEESVTYKVDGRDVAQAQLDFAERWGNGP